MILLQKIIDNKYYYQPSWVMVLIVLSVIIIGYLFSSFHLRFNLIVKAFFTMRFSKELAREEYSLTHPVSVFLSINFLLTGSLFILQLISSDTVFFSVSEMNFVSFLLVILCVVVVCFFKIFFLKNFGFVFYK